MNDRPQLRLAVPARPENVLVVRQAVAGLGEAVGLSEQRLADLKTVVSEACNNVVLHAYENGDGPLEVNATGGEEGIEVEVSDYGSGFRPRADESGANLGLGLPLIASLSDRFQISGGAGEGTRTTVTLYFEARSREADANGASAQIEDETAIAIAAGAVVRPILSRVLGAIAARADFSLDRLADTVLLGDAVSAHQPDDFTDGLIGVAIRDGDGSLEVRIGPLVEGGGERILAAMDIPAGEHGSLRKLAQSVEVTSSERSDGSPAEFVEIAVSS